MYEQVGASSSDPTVQAGIFPDYLPVILTFVRHLITDFLLSAINSYFNRLQNYFLPPHLKSPKNNPPFYLFVKYAQFSP